MSTVLIIFISVMLLARLSGKVMDWHAEWQSRARFVRNPQGVIWGLEPKARIQGHSTALILFHGFTDNTDIFDDLLEGSKNAPVDWFVPLLPYHGKSMQDLLDFDPYVTQAWMGQYIDAKLLQYDRLVVVGQSMGAAMLINLAAKRVWPEERLKLLLMAPAVYLRTNHWYWRLVFRVYPIMVCNYRLAKRVNSADEKAATKLNGIVSFNNRRHVLPAVAALHRISSDAEKALKSIKRSLTILVAKDDNRVNAQTLQRVVANQSNIQLELFENGRHLLYWSQQAHIVIERINQAIAQQPDFR